MSNTHTRTATCEHCGAPLFHADDSFCRPQCEAAYWRQFRESATAKAQAAAHRDARRAKRTLSTKTERAGHA